MNLWVKASCLKIKMILQMVLMLFCNVGPNLSKKIIEPPANLHVHDLMQTKTTILCYLLMSVKTN